MAEVFLSYSRKDEVFVKDLYQRLTRDGVDCFFDQESIEWGENWVTTLEKAIDQCSHIVLVLSNEFVNSEWGKREWTSAIADDPAGLERKIRPLLLKPCDIPRFLKPTQVIDVTTPALFEEKYPQICKNLGGHYVPPTNIEDRNKLPPISKLPRSYRMPYRSLGNGFVGRIEDLWKIDDILRERNTAVVEGVGMITGTGGIGKTQLAIEYVHRFGVNYRGGVFWVDADRGISMLIQQVSQSADVQIDDRTDESRQLQSLWRDLHDKGDILIVLDNFPEKGPLQPWLPPSDNIHTLVTTRRRDLNKYSRIPLDFLSKDEGVALLNSGERKFGEEAEKLVESLGGLALALELAQNFLNLRKTITIEQLLKELDHVGVLPALTQFSKKYDDQLPSGHSKQVAATIQLSWDLASPQGQLLLQNMSFLAPKPIPRSLLRKIMGYPEEVLFEDPIDDLISALASNLSLLERDEDNDPWAHRLICGFARSTLDNKELLIDGIIRTIEQELERTEDEKDWKVFSELQKVIPHAEYVISLEGTPSINKMNIADTLCNYYQKMGKYQLAKRYGSKALEVAMLDFEPGHPSIARSQSNLALVLQDLGELEEARDLLEKALASAQQSFEPGHPSIATSQSNLALVLKDLGELEEARKLIQSAYNSFLDKFGENHHYTVISKENLDSIMGY